MLFKSSRMKKMRGYALMIALAIMPLLLILADTVIVKSMTDLNFIEHDNGMKHAFFIAEGGEAVAMHLLSASNYKQFTHDSSKSAITDSTRLTIPAFDDDSNFVLAVDPSGWYKWE